MEKLWKSLLLMPGFCGVMLFVNAAAFAGETPTIPEINQPQVVAIPNNTINNNNNQEEVMLQVTSVSQLSDVQPTDWAFQALQSLVERYGCIAGYPNKTFRGNRALTRYEFAGWFECLSGLS